MFVWKVVLPSLLPGGICDSGRNALADISRCFIVWWWSTWKWMIMRRRLAVVSRGRVLVPSRPWWVAVALRGSIAHKQNLCMPGPWNKADANLFFFGCWVGCPAQDGCQGDVPVFSMTLLMLISQTVLNHNVQWQLRVLFIRIYSNKQFLTSDFCCNFQAHQEATELLEKMGVKS